MYDVPPQSVAESVGGASGEPSLPRRTRVAAYAVILRDGDILLSRLAPYLVPHEQWTLPGGGIDFGEDPRDAVVMLSALAVGLASGTGHLALAIFATLFLVLLLWFVEGFERATRAFELSVKLGERSEGLQPKIEQVLRRHDIDYELRAVSEEGSTYLVTVPHEVSTSKLSKEMAGLAPDGKVAVEWNEAPKSQKK